MVAFGLSSRGVSLGSAARSPALEDSEGAALSPHQLNLAVAMGTTQIWF